MYKDKYGNTYTVESQCVETIFDLVDMLIKPMLLAAGFHPESVAEALGDEEKYFDDDC
jgi:hypothetical protein